MARDIYDGFIEIVGLREEIEEIIRLSYDEETSKTFISNLPKGKYV